MTPKAPSASHLAPLPLSSGLQPGLAVLVPVPTSPSQDPFCHLTYCVVPLFSFSSTIVSLPPFSFIWKKAILILA